MAMTPPVTTDQPPARRRLRVIPGGRHDAAVRRAQEARRLLQPRHERFAHLKRSYD